MKHDVRTTSKLAWEELKDSPRRAKSMKEVINTLHRHGPLTGRELSFKADHEGLWKRLSEMRREGLIEERGKRRCTVTNRIAVVWGLPK